MRKAKPPAKAASTSKSLTVSAWLKLADPDKPHIERLILLSDGVFAIAMTLLALDVRLPDHAEPNFAAQLHALVLPLLAYFASFLVLGWYWYNHRRYFALLERIDGTAAALNIAGLAFVALIPPSIAIFVHYPEVEGSWRFYFATIFALGAAQTAFWFYVALWQDYLKGHIVRGYRLWYCAMSAANLAAILPFFWGFHFHPREDAYPITLDPAPTALAALFMALGLFAQWRQSRAHMG